MRKKNSTQIAIPAISVTPIKNLQDFPPLRLQPPTKLLLTSKSEQPTIIITSNVTETVVHSSDQDISCENYDDIVDMKEEQQEDTPDNSNIIDTYKNDQTVITEEESNSNEELEILEISITEEDEELYSHSEEFTKPLIKFDETKDIDPVAAIAQAEKEEVSIKETITVKEINSLVAPRKARKKRCKNPELDIFEGVTPTTCEFCFTKFTTIQAKEVCSKGHQTEEKPYRCKKEGCQSKFKDRSGLRNHYKAHIEGKKYACTICTAMFNQKGNLNVHERVHYGEKPFVCSTCGKRFSESGNLKTHLRFHTDERPYQCRFCEKKFRTHYSHKIHERTHTNERPFCCDICTKSFYSSGKLQNHRRIHTGERPYKCKVGTCAAAFVESNGLRRHSRTHIKKEDTNISLKV
jgi:hypothetical protein